MLICVSECKADNYYDNYRLSSAHCTYHKFVRSVRQTEINYS